MNRERARELLPIIKAFAEGKTIQFKNDNHQWRDPFGNDLRFDASPEKYRIKPEPREFWIVAYSEDDIDYRAFWTKGRADEVAHGTDGVVVHAREVIE